MKQYKVFILLIQVFLIIQISLSGFERIAQPTSVFSKAMSGSAVFNTDNVWLNPASIAMNSLFSTSVFYSPSPFELPQLSHYGLLMATNFNEINVAAGFTSFGFSLYRETVFSLSVGAKLTEAFAAGISIHGEHLSIQSYGSALSPVFDAGAIISLSNNFNLGVSLNNISRSSFGKDDDIPQTFLSGFSYTFLENATLTADLVHDIRYSTEYRAGIEFSPHEIITLRAGTQSGQSRIFGGIEIALFSLRISYGIATHTELGLSHSIGIIFSH